MTTTPTIEAVKSMIEYGYSIGADRFGIRAIYADEAAEIGAYCNDSFVWDDGEQTEVKLDGTCAMELKTGWNIEVTEELVAATIAKVSRFASSGRFALIGGPGGEYGAEDGEVVIKNARVLGVW